MVQFHPAPPPQPVSSSQVKDRPFRTGYALAVAPHAIGLPAPRQEDWCLGVDAERATILVRLEWVRRTINEIGDMRKRTRVEPETIHVAQLPIVNLFRLR